MAGVVKVLGQAAPSATTLTAAYTCASVKGATISTITVANRHASQGAFFRIAVAVAGAADTTKQYLYYDIAIGPRDTFAATIGISLQNTDVVRVYASTANLSFNLFGIEFA